VPATAITPYMQSLCTALHYELPFIMRRGVCDRLGNGREGVGGGGSAVGQLGNWTADANMWLPRY
jgi:hypothetical protein